MFENFVIFTEVVKLSSNIFYYLRQVNYHNKLLKIIRHHFDIKSAEQVFELVEDVSLLIDFIQIIPLEEDDEIRRRWIDCIFKAIEENNLDISDFKHLLICECCRFGMNDRVKLLMSKLADVNEISDALMMIAIDFSNLEIIKYLVENGFEINKPRMYFEDHPLTSASCVSNLEVVKYLFENPKVNISQGNLFAGCLLNACCGGNPSNVKYLLDKQQTVTNGVINLCFQQAINNSNIEIVKLLCQRVDIIAYKIIRLTVKLNRVEIFKYLLDNKFDKKVHRSLLELSKEFGTTEITKYIESKRMNK